jgi:hypothetical protein
MSAFWRWAATLTVAGMLATSLVGCVSQQVADRANQRAMLSGLTQAEFQVASHVARREAAREGADVTTASADLVAGSRRAVLGVHRSDCPSGPLLHIQLIGSFPRATPGPGNGSDAPVSGEDVLADPVTGKVCAHSYLFGRILAPVAMTRLFSR